MLQDRDPEDIAATGVFLRGCREGGPCVGAECVLWTVELVGGGGVLEASGVCPKGRCIADCCPLFLL